MLAPAPVSKHSSIVADCLVSTILSITVITYSSFIHKVVINESLMDNHQEELARALKEKCYLEYCLPEVNTNNNFYLLLHITLIKEYNDGFGIITRNEVNPIPTWRSKSD